VWPPAPSAPADITLDFFDVGFSPSARVKVFDVWSETTVGIFVGSYTAKGVAFHANAFVRLSLANE